MHCKLKKRLNQPSKRVHSIEHKIVLIVLPTPVKFCLKLSLKYYHNKKGKRYELCPPQHGDVIVNLTIKQVQIHKHYWHNLRRDLNLYRGEKNMMVSVLVANYFSNVEQLKYSDYSNIMSAKWSKVWPYSCMLVKQESCSRITPYWDCEREWNEYSSSTFLTPSWKHHHT